MKGKETTTAAARYETVKIGRYYYLKISRVGMTRDRRAVCRCDTWDDADELCKAANAGQGTGEGEG